MSIHLQHTIRPKNSTDWLLKWIRQISIFSRFLLILILYSPILIYQWIRNKLQPGYGTIADIDDSAESVYGFTGSWYNSACINTPVKLIQRYVDVSTLNKINHNDTNRLFINFFVIKITSIPENLALNNMFFTRSFFKFKAGVLLQAINPYNEKWELIYYDLEKNEEKSLKRFNTFFILDKLTNDKNGIFILSGSNKKQKIEIKISTTNTA